MDYNVIAKAEDDGSLVCSGCDRTCVVVDKGRSDFCEKYRGSMYDRKTKLFKVKCEERP